MKKLTYFFVLFFLLTSYVYADYFSTGHMTSTTSYVRVDNNTALYTAIITNEGISDSEGFYYVIFPPTATNINIISIKVNDVIFTDYIYETGGNESWMLPDTKFFRFSAGRPEDPTIRLNPGNTMEIIFELSDVNGIEQQIDMYWVGWYSGDPSFGYDDKRLDFKSPNKPNSLINSN